MASQDLLVKIEGGVMSLTLNRPEALNALSKAMITGLMDAFEQARRDPSVRVITISGAGRSFCSGGDVKGMGKASPAEAYDNIGRLNRVILTLSELDQPIIAVVHGYAAGAGVCLAMACDQILAAEDSKFVLSFSRVGLVSDGGGHFFLPRVLGIYRAKELLFNAEPLDAPKAMDWGMVNRIYPAEQLQEEAMRYAMKLAKGPRRAYGMMKKIANQALVADLATILERERTTQAMIMTTADHQEGVQAFKERREPNFAGE